MAACAAGGWRRRGRVPEDISLILVEVDFFGCADLPTLQGKVVARQLVPVGRRMFWGAGGLRLRSVSVRAVRGRGHPVPGCSLWWASRTRRATAAACGVHGNEVAGVAPLEVSLSGAQAPFGLGVKWWQGSWCPGTHACSVRCRRPSVAQCLAVCCRRLTSSHAEVDPVLGFPDAEEDSCFSQHAWLNGVDDGGALGGQHCGRGWRQQPRAGAQPNSKEHGAPLA